MVCRGDSKIPEDIDMVFRFMAGEIVAGCYNILPSSLEMSGSLSASRKKTGVPATVAPQMKRAVTAIRFGRACLRVYTLWKTFQLRNDTPFCEA
jgi:hypothetical protein